MKTRRLTKLESIAYTNDERRFWLAEWEKERKG